MDGSVLSAPYDPGGARDASPKRDSAPPPTELISVAKESLPPTRAATPDLQSTIATPFAQQPMQRPAQPFAPEEINEVRPLPEIVRWMFILRGGVAILFGILLLLWRAQ